MNSIKKIIAAFAAAVMALSVLAGCGANNKSDDSKKADTKATTEAATEKSAETDEKDIDADDTDITGEYSFVSMKADGESLTAGDLANYGMDSSSFALKLNTDGTFVMTVMDESQEGEWTQDGDTVTLTAEGEDVTGTVDGGTITLEDDDVSIVFEKK